MFVCPCAFHMGILPLWKSFVHRRTVHMVTQSSKSFNTCIPVSFIREPYHHRNVRVPLCLSYGHPTIMEVFCASLHRSYGNPITKIVQYMYPRLFHKRNPTIIGMFVCPCAFHMGILPSWKSFVHRCTVHMVTQSSKLFNTCIPVSFIRKPYHHRNVRVPLCLSFGHPTIMEVFCASLQCSYGNSIIKIVQYMYPRLFHKGTLPS